MNYTTDANPKNGEKANERSEVSYDNITSQIAHKKENTIFTSQLKELAKHFSSIENDNIREFAINLVREIAKCENEEKAKAYMDEFVEPLK